MLKYGIMDKSNNFHRLLDDELSGAPPLPPQIKQRVQDSMSLMQFMGKVLELYVPNALDTVLVAINGGESESPRTDDDSTESPDEQLA